MCGIAGLLAPELPPHERLEHVAGMVRRLRHRGPSGEALHDADGAALGLARLAIVAPHESARVLRNEDGRILAVANGEIYDHAEHLSWLRTRGHQVPAGPDTAVLPHLYEELGSALVERLDGMFAFALWDRITRTLLLARDKAGEKPLYHTRGSGPFAFASEPGALVGLPWVSREPAPGPLARYLVHGYFGAPDTPYRGLRQLPPGHVLVKRDRGTRLRRYWRPWDAVGEPSPALEIADAPTAAREALAAAVRSRLSAEVPFGVFLSGGVDSGLVAVLCRRATARRFPTFSMGIAHRGYDERGFARQVADSIGAEHHELAMGPDEGAEAFECWARTMDQPLGDPSVLPTWALARLAAKHVPVILTGEGGDELFAGYPTYLGHRWAGVADHLPGPVAAAVLALARRSRPAHHHVTLAHLVERFVGTRGLRPFERHLAWWGTAGAGEARALLAPGLRAALEPGAPLAHAERVARDLVDAGLMDADRAPGLTAFQLLDFETYLPGALLTKVDRCTMAHGLESRAPFLRASLVELALGLPERDRLRGVTGKWALKRAARGLLPRGIVARRKQGFSPPFSAWVRGPMRAVVEDILSPTRIGRAGILEPGAVQRILRGHLEAREDRGRTLWMLVSLQCWAEHWVQGRPEEAVHATVRPAAAGSLAPSTSAAEPAGQTSGHLRD
jgi:asparagine synthase (glutamine-hydrolysing)